jgi:prophage DNA circulation protein
MRRTYTSRQEGVTARAMAAERFEVELDDTTGAANAALFVAIQNLRGRVVDYLSRLITDLAPVVTVEASRQMPSLFWAWRLYADPTRSDEPVARNQVRHPSFMPTVFQALAR